MIMQGSSRTCRMCANTPWAPLRPPARCPGSRSCTQRSRRWGWCPVFLAACRTPGWSSYFPSASPRCMGEYFVLKCNHFMNFLDLKCLEIYFQLFACSKHLLFFKYFLQNNPPCLNFLFCGGAEIGRPLSGARHAARPRQWVDLIN